MEIRTLSEASAGQLCRRKRKRDGSADALSAHLSLARRPHSVLFPLYFSHTDQENAHCPVWVPSAGTVGGLSKRMRWRDTEMKKNLTELVMILDRSGSMGGLESDTIGGYNSMLRKQREAEGEVLVSTVLFDNTSEVLYDRIPLREMPQMTEKEYYVRGSTALLDAIGGAIHHIGNVHKYAREEDRPEKTIFVITTDGFENASRRYTYEKVRQMVERQKEKYGWEFLFLGANMDAIETAGRFGIAADRAVNYNSDAVGTALNYEVLADTVCEMRASAAPIDGSWKRRIEADFDRRGGRK